MKPNTTTQGRPRAAGLIAAAVLVALAQTIPAAAVSSRIWKQRERSDFEQGEPHGVALTADGSIRLGSRLDRIFDPGQPYIWAVAVDGHGVVYAAGGNEGQIYRIGPKGRETSVLQVEEPGVQALMVDGSGALYAGTAPGGKVYKFSPEGRQVWVADTGEKYVWALAPDRRGGLFAGTGIEGRVIHVDVEGRCTPYFDTAETHIRSLAIDPHGSLLAGTDGHGLVFRITAQDQGTVLYDAPLAEVPAGAAAPDGTIYAAVMGEAGRPPRMPQQRPTPPAGTPEGGETPPQPQPQQETQPQGVPPEQRITVGTEGKVLAISPDGYAREVWAAGQEGILSLALQHDGGLLMGSGSQGRVYLADTDGGVSEIARTESSQVTALLKRPAVGGGEEFVVGGSNLGSVSILRPAHAEEGRFESKVLDAQSFATWGRAYWRADTPAGTSVVLQTRSGNTEDPDRTWSDWGSEMGDAEGGRIDRPPARFLQWRAILRTSQPAHTPDLREVDIVYMQKNLPPEFRKLEVLPPGVSLQAIPQPPQPQGQEGKSGGDSDSPRHRPRPQSRRGYDPGARSLTWQVTDPNDDDLVYDVQFREAGEKTWKTVRTKIDEDFVTFDGTALPDGTYLVRVVASDAPSNSAKETLTAEKVSPPFDVDNTPPRVEHLKAETGKGTLHVTFAASDGFSVLREASVSVDAADWVLAQPVDGLCDSRSEDWSIELPGPPAGEHSIVVRVVDAAGNTGSGRTVVETP
jgi:hypothetical protein